MGGMNGMEAAKALRAQSGTVVIGEDKLPVSRSYQATALAAIARAMLE